MVVFAFDRDWTVDVNPPPDRTAVPLDWIQHLAHETTHPVYATGNQLLVDEAGIPGVEAILDRLGGDGQPGEREAVRPGRSPGRRERLALIQRLHPDADRFVVVDDVDLSDVEGWEHYYAWDFVPAVERGAIDPDLPWADEPITDGGLVYPHGIAPSSAAKMETYLESYGDGAGYELTYRENGARQTCDIYGCTPVEESFARPSAKRALQCYPVEPTVDEFTVAEPDIEDLDPIPLAGSAPAEHAESPVQHATGLGRLAAVAPEEVRLPSLLGLLEESDEAIDREALNALRRLADARPEDCAAALPILRSRLEETSLEPTSLRRALETIETIAEADAAAVAPLTETLEPYLRSSATGVPKTTARAVAEIATDHPDDARRTVPGLVALLEADVKAQGAAVYALSVLSREEPGFVESAAERLGELVVDQSVPTNTRLNAGAAFGRCVGESPSLGVEFVEELIPVLESDNHKLRNNAAGIVGDVAKLHADVVEPYVDDLAPLLTVDDDFTRVNTSAAASRVADDFPASVAHLTETFVELLGDDESLVRVNACWALGHLEAASAEAELAEVALEDDDQHVRNRAAWAHARLGERAG